MSVQGKQLEWLQLLAKKSPTDQYYTVKHCHIKLIRDLNKLIKHITYGKNVTFSPEEKIFFKKHIIFVDNFLSTRSVNKKRDNLLRKVKGGFLSLLIPAIVSIAGAVIPELLEK